MSVPPSSPSLPPIPSTPPTSPKPRPSTSLSPLHPVYHPDPEPARRQRRHRLLQAQYAAAIDELMEYEHNMPPAPNTSTIPLPPHPHSPANTNNSPRISSHSPPRPSHHCNTHNNVSTTAIPDPRPQDNTAATAAAASSASVCTHSCCAGSPSPCSGDDFNIIQSGSGYAILDDHMLPQHAVPAEIRNHNTISIPTAGAPSININSNASSSIGSKERKKEEAKAAKSSDDLRASIVAITQDPKLTADERDAARQRLYTSKYSTRKSDEALAYMRECERNKHTLSYSQHRDADGKQLLGCVHYARNCKIQAPCCGMWVACRRCHDVACITTDHTIDRFAISRVLCMVCDTEQGIGQYCSNAACGVRFAHYYCHHCRFFDNAPGKEIYHCDKCKLCRVGKGLGRDNYHCDKCNACVSLESDGKDSHRCLQASLDADCPICGDYMLTSTTQVVFMQCGHAMHHSCFDQYTATNYVCPICAKTLTDMSAYYREIDRAVAQQPLPPPFNLRKVEIRCHNCDIRSITNFHFIYLKCVQCNGYNTRLIRDVPDHEQVRVLASNG